MQWKRLPTGVLVNRGDNNMTYDARGWVSLTNNEARSLTNIRQHDGLCFLPFF